MKTKHWIVVKYHDSCGIQPSKRPKLHTDRASAILEAARLARTETGSSFIVYEATSISHILDVVTEEIS